MENFKLDKNKSYVYSKILKKNIDNKYLEGLDDPNYYLQKDNDFIIGNIKFLILRKIYKIT